MGALDAQNAAQEAQSLRDQIARAKTQATGATATALDEFDQRIDTAFLSGTSAPVGSSDPPAPRAAVGRGGRGRGGALSAAATLNGPAAGLAAVMNTLQSADAPPTALQVKTMEAALANARAAIARWNTLKTTELTALNARLKAAGAATIARVP